MPRQPRVCIPQIPAHLIQRGNNKTACFFSNKDRDLYLHKLEEYSKRFGVAVHNYVLMTNHVHLLVTPEDECGISLLMQFLGRSYVKYFNASHDRTGTLWEGRFRMSLVDSDSYFYTVSRYIEMNPVRAGIVKHPSGYRWSSYMANADGRYSSVVTQHKLYMKLGANPRKRSRAYRQLFVHGENRNDVELIRYATNRCLPLGQNDFINKLEKASGKRLLPGSHGGDRKSVGFRAKIKSI